ncbi:hypothetical protein ACMFMG_002514 [Clarireedia jacksonii]
MEINNNNNNKGKGKGTSETPNPPISSQDGPPAPPSSSPSFLSRVSASASGLTRSALTAAPGASEMRNGSVAAMTNGKVGSHSSSAGAGASASAADWGGNPRGDVMGEGGGVGGTRGDLSRETRDHVREAEEQFSRFLDAVDGEAEATMQEEGYEGGRMNGSRHSPQLETSRAWEMVWEETRSSGLGAGSGSGSGSGVVASQPGSAWVYKGESASGYHSIPEQEAHDGEEVLNILNSPGDIGGSSFPSIPEFEKEMYEEENVDWGLDAEQMAKIREISGKLLGEVHGRLDVDHVLNLRPRFGEETGAGFGEASLRDWDGVLNGYADEVWGGLAPLVREAREEVERLKEGGNGAEERGDVKALRRLRAVLGHLGRG